MRNNFKRENDFSLKTLGTGRLKKLLQRESSFVNINQNKSNKKNLPELG